MLVPNCPSARSFRYHLEIYKNNSEESNYKTNSLNIYAGTKFSYDINHLFYDQQTDSYISNIGTIIRRCDENFNTILAEADVMDYLLGSEFQFSHDRLFVTNWTDIIKSNSIRLP